ncbi:MAG TPA: response regulator transcription factor [Chthoniobacterales bacterium]|nr:response regulator transcription factor [Chthoniobacterales bacterium]
MRILIADDQKDVGRSLADLVRFCNHQVVGVVASGLEAIQAYARYQPDLVLMDYRMPKLNGATACRNILSKDPAARVILVSAWSPSDDASASGAIAMLPKPVSLEQLDAALNRVAETLPALSPAEMPFPEFCFQADPVDYPISDFQPFVPTPNFDLPTPNSELEAPSFPPVAEPLPVVPPSLEMNFHVDAPPNPLQQTGEACAVADEKIPIKPRRNARRRAHRARVR